MLIYFNLFVQNEQLHRRGGGDLCDLRHVVHPGQLRAVPHRGARVQQQAPAVRQRNQPSHLLGGKLRLGYGMGQHFMLSSVLRIVSYISNCNVLLVSQMESACFRCMLYFNSLL